MFTKVILIAAILSFSGLAFAQTHASSAAGNERGGRPQPAPQPHPIPMPPTPRPQPGTDSPSLESTIVPFQKWSPLGAHAQGLLVMDTVQGVPLLAYSGENTYKFVEGSDSPVVVYFPSSGEGVNYMQDWQVPSSNGYVASVAQFGKDNQNPWGLSEDIEIVDVEVNGGNGGSGDIHFVPSKTTVLSIQKAMNPSEKLNDFLKPYSNVDGAESQLIVSQLDQIVMDRKARDSGYTQVKNDRSSPTTGRGFMVRLSDAGDQIKFVYYSSRDYSYWQSSGGMSGPHCQPGHTVTQYGAEFARTIIEDATGNVVDDESVTKPYIKSPVSYPGACMPIDPLPPHPKCPNPNQPHCKLPPEGPRGNQSGVQQ